MHDPVPRSLGWESKAELVWNYGLSAVPCCLSHNVHVSCELRVVDFLKPSLIHFLIHCVWSKDLEKLIAIFLQVHWCVENSLCIFHNYIIRPYINNSGTDFAGMTLWCHQLRAELPKTLNLIKIIVKIGMLISSPYPLLLWHDFRCSHLFWVGLCTGVCDDWFCYCCWMYRNVIEYWVSPQYSV